MSLLEHLFYHEDYVAFALADIEKNQNLTSGYSVVFMLPYNSLI